MQNPLTRPPCAKKEKKSKCSPVGSVEAIQFQATKHVIPDQSIQECCMAFYVGKNRKLATKFFAPNSSPFGIFVFPRKTHIIRELNPHGIRF